MTAAKMNSLLSALKRARPWLNMIACEKGRPETSDIHAVLAQVDEAIATEAFGQDPQGLDAKHEGAGRSEAEVSPKRSQQ